MGNVVVGSLWRIVVHDDEVVLHFMPPYSVGDDDIAQIVNPYTVCSIRRRSWLWHVCGTPVVEIGVRELGPSYIRMAFPVRDEDVVRSFQRGCDRIMSGPRCVRLLYDRYSLPLSPCTKEQYLMVPVSKVYEVSPPDMTDVESVKQDDLVRPRVQLRLVT